MRPIEVAEHRAIPVPVDAAFRGTQPVDLTVLFSHWYGPLPPIKEVREQDGVWGTVGQTRTVALTGGGTMREELVAADAPNSFGYVLTAITGALGPLVDHIDGRWTFGAAGTGTDVGWEWTLYPKSAAARPAVVLIGRLWRGYARRALADLSDLLVAAH